MPKLTVLLGSTRPARAGQPIAHWFVEQVTSGTMLLAITKVVDSTPKSKDADVAARLWSVSEELTGVTYDVLAAGTAYPQRRVLPDGVEGGHEDAEAHGEAFLTDRSRTFNWRC